MKQSVAKVSRVTSTSLEFLEAPTQFVEGSTYDPSLIKDDLGPEDALLEVLREGHLNSKVGYSLMLSCNAAGEILSPMVVYWIKS
jgi:hypothetical protein